MAFWNKSEEIVEQPKVELRLIKASTDNILDDVLQHFINNKPKSLMNVQRGVETKENLLNEVERFLLNRRIDIDQVSEIQDRFAKFIWGYHVLEDLINDPDISDIKIISENNIRIKKLGKRMTSDVKFNNKEELKRFISIVAIKNKTNISDINAIQSFTDIDSNKDFILRFNIATQYVTSVGTPYLHIRKIPKEKYSKEKLIELGLATKEQMDFLIDKVKNGNGIIFTGKGASGKTTLMNVLLDEIPHDKSGLVIQENEELFTKTHPDLMFQKVRTSKGEGKIQYQLKDLAINGLLIDLDYFAIGEIKGGEALYVLNASYTGHKIMCSVHGVSSTQALNKLVDYMKYESDYSKVDLMKMLPTMDTVVFLKDFAIQEISEIECFDDAKQDLKYNMVFLGKEKINNSLKEKEEEEKEKINNLLKEKEKVFSKTNKKTVEKKVKSINTEIKKAKEDKDNLKKVEREKKEKNNKILALKSKGFSNKEIAAKLECSLYMVTNAIKKG